MASHAVTRADRRARAVRVRPHAAAHLSEPAITARRWGWRHPGRAAWALRGVDLRVDEGERVLLLGASGAGKSTLLMALAGLLDRGGAADEEGELRVRGDAGLVLQDPETQLVMARAGDDVAFGLENRCVPTAEIWPRVHRALADVGFPYAADRATAALSGGEKQRLAIAGIVALRPRVLLLDEPTANLDESGTCAIHDVLARLGERRDVTLVIVEHRLEAILPLIDRVVVIEAGGGVVADGPPDRVFTTYGERLSALGVWRPGETPRAPARGQPGPVFVEAHDLVFRYPRAPAPALEHVSAEVRTGEALAITGANGSGKSTLAMLLAGLLTPLAGQVRAMGEAPSRWSSRRLVERIGSVFQDPEHQFVAARVDLELGVGPQAIGMGVDARARTVSDLLERLDLAKVGAANPFTLSGGEKRRLSVGTALATAPHALVLDEPSFGQDRRTFEELLALLAEYRARGGAIAFASHDPLFVDALADRRLELIEGRAS